MQAPQDLAQRIADKHNDELLAMLASPDDWTPEALEAAKAELRARNVDTGIPAALAKQDVAAVTAPPPDWNSEEIRKKRYDYLVVFLLMIITSIVGSGFGMNIGFLANLVLGGIFLTIFVTVVQRVLGYSTVTLLGLSLVILFVPFLSLLLIAIVDRKVYDAIRQGEPLQSPIRPQLSSLAVCSLVLCLLPYIGLPMAIYAVRRITHSNGRLYGEKCASVSVVVNAAFLLFMIVGIATWFISIR